MRTYGVGVVGLGVQGLALLDELDASPRLAVVAASDPHPPARPGLPLVDGLEAVCADPAVDVVYIASPPAHHAAAVRRALAAGKAVLCEKPLAPDAAEAASLAAEAAAAGVPTGVNFYLATAPAGLALAAAVAGGALGAVRSVALETSFARWPRSWQAGAGDWLSSSAEGGFTREVVSHFVFLADRLLGPGRVEAVQIERDARGLERAVTARLRHGAVPFTIDAAIRGDVEERGRFTVACERGELAIVDWDGYVGPPQPATLAAGVTPALAALLDGEPTALPDLAAGARVAASIERLLAERA